MITAQVTFEAAGTPVLRALADDEALTASKEMK